VACFTTITQKRRQPVQPQPHLLLLFTLKYSAYLIELDTLGATL
jgi:hypothetical protein